MDIKNRRLIQGEDIVYPITRQENVIGLQKTITDKMTIASSSVPIGEIVEKQIWLQIDQTDDIPNQNFSSGGVIENNYEALQENNYGSEDDVIENNYEGED